MSQQRAPERPAGTRRLSFLDGMQPRIVVAVLADTVGAGAFYPLTLVYLDLTTPYPLAQIGLLLTVGAVLALVLGPLTGGLVDRFTARRVLVANNLVSAAGYLLLFVVRSPAQLLAAVLLIAFSERLYWAGWPVFVAERVAGRRMERWYATINAVRSGSLGLGAVAASGALALGGAGVLRALLVFNVVTSLLAAVLVTGAAAPRPATSGPATSGPAAGPPAPGRREQESGWRTVLADRRLAALIVAHTLLAFAWLLPALVLPIYIVQTLRLPGWWASVAFAANTVVVTLLQRWLVDSFARLRRTRTIVLGAAAIVLCILLEALANGAVVRLSAALMIAGVLLLSFAESLIGPAVNALVMTLPAENNRGRYSALFGVSWTIPTVTGPALVGFLLGWNVLALWGVLGVLITLGALGFLAVERHLPPGAVSASDHQAPDHQAPDHQAPDRRATDHQAPDRQVPDRRASDQPAPAQ